MNGLIGLEEIRIDCIIGDLPEERVKKQVILVDLKVEAEIDRCLYEDDLAYTVDYVALADECKRVAREGKFRMLETYAGEVLQQIFKKFAVQKVWIKVKKPGSISFVKHSFVEIALDRQRWVEMSSVSMV